MRKIVAVEHNSPPMDHSIKVEWNLSKRCNFDCSYCSVNTHDKTSGFPDWPALQRTVDTLAASSKTIRVGITGGEPTLCPDFLRLVSYMKDKGISYVSVTTNGSRGEKFLTAALDHLDGLVFSLHFEYFRNSEVLSTILSAHKKVFAINQNAGHKVKRLHVHLMMLPGHFQKAEEAIDVLRSEGVIFAIRTIRPTYRKTPTGEYIRVNPYEAPGKVRTTDRGPDYSQDEGFYNPEEMEWLKARQAKANFNNCVTILEDANGVCVAHQENVNDYLANQENRYQGWRCFSGIQSLWIGSDGKVFNANCQVTQLGSVSEGFELLSQPVTCARNFCTCAADLNTTKIKDPKYLAQTRLGGGTYV